MRRLAAAVVLLAACGPYSTPKLEGRCGAAILPMDVVISPDLAGEEASVREAAAWWGPGLFLADEDLGARWDACAFGCVGTATLYHAELPDGVAGDTALAPPGEGPITACDVRLSVWWYAAPEVVAHELGHCLGLGHSDDPDSIMHSPTAQWARPSADEIATAIEGCE